MVTPYYGKTDATANIFFKLKNIYSISQYPTYDIKIELAIHKPLDEGSVKICAKSFYC